MPLADIDGLSRDALDSLGPRGHCTARDARVWSLHTSGLDALVSCVCGEGGLVALCEPSVCSCAFQSVNSARVVYKRAGGGAILRTRRLVSSGLSHTLSQHFLAGWSAAHPLPCAAFARRIIITCNSSDVAAHATQVFSDTSAQTTRTNGIAIVWRRGCKIARTINI